MNRLSVRLTLAIVLTTLLAVALVALIANRTAGAEFRRYLAAGQAERNAELAASLAGYYAQSGSWDGVARALDAVEVSPGMGMGGRGQMRGRGGMGTIWLADAAGQVIYDGQGQRVGDDLSRSELAAAQPLVAAGNVVGYLLVASPGQIQLQGAERVFLNRVNAALLAAAAVAILVGVLAGGLLARNLAAPLNRVARAAGALAAGDLSERVPEQGADEIRAVARSFNQMAASLEQSEQLRRNLVADVAHELRTPLTVIQGNLQALLDGVYPLERAEIATIYDETRLLSRLVADLRELAQAEAGQLKLDLQPTDVAALLRQTVDSFGPFAEDKKLNLQLDLAGPLPLAMADPDRTAQILRNLIANSLRHVPAGGRVWVSAAPADRGLHIAVADNGPGIAADALPHIFDRFWTRSTGDGQSDAGGSGLGLAITRHLVEAQGGQIGVKSELGQGTEFWFTLHLAPA